MPLHIEIAQSEQAEEVAALIREVFAPQAALLDLNPRDHKYYASFEIEQNVRQRMAQGVVAIGYEGDRLVGTISFEIDPKWMRRLGWNDRKEHFGWIERLAVRLDFRGHGYGAELMAWDEARLAEREIRRIRLAIVARFDRLRAFYERLGYQLVETQRFEPYPYEVLFMEKEPQ